MKSVKKGVIWFFSFVFIAESDSGGDFTVRKTYNSPIFHIYINVGENLFLGVLIDFYKKKRKSSNIFTSIQVWIYDKSYVFLMVKSPPESDSAMKKKWKKSYYPLFYWFHGFRVLDMGISVLNFDFRGGIVKII